VPTWLLHWLPLLLCLLHHGPVLFQLHLLLLELLLLLHDWL
jgi:hypothetical protein